MFWKMPSNMSPVQLRIRIIHVCLVFVLFMSPTVSSFPRGLSDLDSIFRSYMNYTSEETFEDHGRDHTAMIDYDEVTCEYEGHRKCLEKNQFCYDNWFGGYRCSYCDSNYMEIDGKCVLDVCSDYPCKNDGICKMENGTLSCYCRFPFYGKTCEKEYNPSTLETTMNISDWTTFIPSNFTNYDNMTTAEQWNTTAEATTSSFEPSNFTSDFNVTEVPREFTSHFNVTSDNNQTEPWNSTEEYYRTTKESSTHTQYRTSGRPVDFTFKYTKTSDFKDFKTGAHVTTPVYTTSNPITAPTPKPGSEFIFRNVYSILNLTEVIIKT